MTKVTNAFTTYSAIGNREDLTDLISNISPLEAPAFDRWKTVKATGRLHEWQTDALAAAAANAEIEGATFSGGARTATTRYNNTCQLMLKMFSISDTQEVVDKAGRKSELAYQKAKAMKELKRDMEFAIFASAATVSVSGSTGNEATAPVMKSVDGWQVLVVGQTGSVGGAGGVGSGNGVTATLGEATFNAEIQRAWDNGARVNTVYTNGSLKRLISSWGVSTSRPRDVGEGKRLVNVVDFYLTDFGEVEVVLDRYVATSQMFLLDDNLWAKAFLVPTREAEIAKTGLASNTMIWNQWTIEARNPTGNAMLWSKP